MDCTCRQRVELEVTWQDASFDCAFCSGCGDLVVTQKIGSVKDDYQVFHLRLEAYCKALMHGLSLLGSGKDSDGVYFPIVKGGDDAPEHPDLLQRL
jgi:hypothetical protein